jgi:hypothetical protein
MPVYVCQPGKGHPEPWRHGIQVYARPFPVDGSDGDKPSATMNANRNDNDNSNNNNSNSNTDDAPSHTVLREATAVASMPTTALGANVTRSLVVPTAGGGHDWMVGTLSSTDLMQDSRNSRNDEYSASVAASTMAQGLRQRRVARDTTSSSDEPGQGPFRQPPVSSSGSAPITTAESQQRLVLHPVRLTNPVAEMSPPVRRIRHAEVVLVDDVCIAYGRYWLRLRWPGHHLGGGGGSVGITSDKDGGTVIGGAGGGSITGSITTQRPLHAGFAGYVAMGRVRDTLFSNLVHPSSSNIMQQHEEGTNRFENFSSFVFSLH